MDMAEYSKKPRQTASRKLICYAFEDNFRRNFLRWPRHDDFVDSLHNPATIDRNFTRAPRGLRRQLRRPPAIYFNRNRIAARGHRHTICKLKSDILTLLCNEKEAGPIP